MPDRLLVASGSTQTSFALHGPQSMAELKTAEAQRRLLRRALDATKERERSGGAARGSGSPKSPKKLSTAPAFADADVPFRTSMPISPISPLYLPYISRISPLSARACPAPRHARAPRRVA